MIRKKGSGPANIAGQGQERRLNAIARVASQLFSSRGYLATSMDDIAAASKITKGGIYYYFASKAEILYFICSRYVDLDVEVLEQSLGSAGTQEAKIRLVISHHISHYCRHMPAARTVLSEAYNLPPRYRSKVKASERRYFELVRGILSGPETGAGGKAVAGALAFNLFGMMNWVYRWYDPKGEIGPERMSELIYETFMNGVGNRSFGGKRTGMGGPDG